MSTSVSQSSVLFLDSLAYSSRSELFAVTTKELVVWALMVCGIFFFQDWELLYTQTFLFYHKARLQHKFLLQITNICKQHCLSVTMTVILSLWIDHQQPKFSSLTRDCAQ